MSVISNTLRDFRGSGEKRPVWECTVSQMSWDNGETNEDTSAISINGVITQIVATYSAAAANMTLAIKDPSGATAYTTTDVDGTTYIKAADGSEFGQNQLSFFDGFTLSVTATDPGVGGVTADIIIRGV
jgi:hypothetical protein